MRIYFDENFSPHLVAGIKAIQEGRKSEETTVCSVVEEFGRGAADEEWIPAIAGKHGVALTQDTSIYRTRAQWALCQKNKIGVFFFKPPKAGWNYWDIVQLVVKHWPQIKELTRGTKRPFGFVIEQSKAKIQPLPV